MLECKNQNKLTFNYQEGQIENPIESEHFIITQSPVFHSAISNILNAVSTEQIQTTASPGDLTTIYKHNESDIFESYPPWVEKDLWWRLILVITIVVFGAAGNLTIIISMCKLRQFRSKPTNIFILNMAIGDLITVVFCPIVALIRVMNQFYVLGPLLCKGEGFVKGKRSQIYTHLS